MPGSSAAALPWADPQRPAQGGVVARGRSALLCLLLCVPVASCSQGGAESRLSDYLQRLARPLDARVEGPQSQPGATPPRAESLQIPLEGNSLDGLDFLRLRGCALQTTVARRNSSLGRVAPPSQRLLLELAFLRDAPDCIATLREEGNDALAGLLEEGATSKRAQLPALIFNATLGSREYRDFWRLRGALGEYPARTSSAVISALERVTADARRWLGGDYRADDSRLELALSEIARGDGGELLASLLLQSAYLGNANTLIDESVAGGPLCERDLQPAAAPILRNVARKYFVARIQPWSAALNQRYHALLTPVTELELLLEHTFPADYRRWQQQRDALFEDTLAAPARHVRRLQSLLGTCYAEFRKSQGAD